MGYYAAVEIREPGKPVRDFCAVCLITLHPFGYKDMSESMGPYIWSAPLEVLQALSPLPSPPVVTEWRDCRYCEGTGHMAAPNQRHECIWCDGSGKQPVHDHERDRHAGARKWRAEAWARHGVQASAA